MEEVDLEEADTELCSGDRLILYSDGITHAESSDGEFFGLERLRQAVSSAGPLSAEALCERIFDRVSRFQAGAAQFDDMAVLLSSVGG
jgi:sigma-B regulation protein RsbU (phosphoserine phosphatase)